VNQELTRCSAILVFCCHALAGTANGGSALMWASILELNGLTNSSVITVDIQKPGVTGAFGADPPAAVSAVMTANGQVVMMPRKRPQQNPVKHPLWNKYVTFVEGSSVDPATITKVKGLLQQKQHALWRSDAEQSRGSSSPSATNTTESGVGGSSSTNERHITSAQRPMRVLVLLDSHHAAAHVLTEMESYCPLVSAGSFCVIEDTKLTRWTNSDPGPMASVQSFLAWHPEFAVDRDRELLFTHHPYGYLQRLY
jgi:cephalosporin hydroxylase